MFIYFLRDRQSVSRREEEREGDTESEAGSIQALSCQRRAWHGAQIMNRETMTWAEVRGLTDWATQVPPKMVFII